MDKVAVVILNWNGAELMKRFLPSVLKYTRGRVYVADNASTDHSLDMLKTDFLDVGIICLDQNYGFAEGYNRALASVEAEYFVLLNSDVELKSDWITPMLEYMEVHPQVAVCQPKILGQTSPDSFEYAGACGGFLDALGYPYCRGRIFNTVEKDNGQYDSVLPIFWATGAAMMVRAQVYRDNGGLDGRFFAHMEEIDFCWRLRSRGYGIVCIPTSVVYHVGGGTLPQKNPRKTFLNFRNNLYMLYKNLSDEQLKSVMRQRVLLDILAALQFLMKGEWGSSKAIFEAYHVFYKNKKSFLKSRRENMAKTILKTVPEQYPYSILWEYYVRRHKTFAEIRD